MNVLNIVIQWFADDEINEQELRECLQNLNVTSRSIDRLVKEAQFERVKARVIKEQARKTSQSQDKEI